ncbi:MAG: potassium-transporting ATPase subunit KdpB [Sulfobacillus sp.]
MSRKKAGMFGRELIWKAVGDSFHKLSPVWMMKNPVMFVVEVGSALSTVVAIRLYAQGQIPVAVFTAQIAAWLWLTVLFANFAEALAEGRGHAQAAALRGTKVSATAKRQVGAGWEQVAATELRRGDVVLCAAGDLIPSDGTVIKGTAAIDESAITGESAPVIREAGGDKSAVTGGTRILSDEVWIEVTANPGETFLDRMISLIEGAVRQKTPNEIALAILLAGLTLIFVVVVMTTEAFAQYSGLHLQLVILVALLVCLAPTTIGGLLSAIGISGMDRLLRHNVLAMSGRAIEAAGDVNVIMLDKTGTLTYGNRMATEFMPLPGVEIKDLAQSALIASLADDTPEGRSIVALAKEQFGLEDPQSGNEPPVYHPFTAQTRMSGVDLGAHQVRKGAPDAVAAYVGGVPAELEGALTEIVEGIAHQGGTPLAVADGGRVIGVIHLKDIVKVGIRDRIAAIRKSGIRTVMITGDNPITARTIADEVGIDECLAQATPERKLEYIEQQKAEGYLVAMVGDGTNDAPALAAADVAVAMNSGTSAAREAANMVDLDSNPIKLIDIVEIGKQILITRGALTTFSIANDVAKYFAILPAMFVPIFPGLEALNVMHLTSPESAVLSAVIFNALIIPMLIPLALRGVRYRPQSAATTLRNNLFVYGLGGLVLPFIGIKLLDMMITALGLVALR